MDGYGVMGIFCSRTCPRVNRVRRNLLAGDVLSLVAYRLRKKRSFYHLNRPPNYTVQFPYLDNWKVFKECGEVGGWVFAWPEYTA